MKNRSKNILAVILVILLALAGCATPLTTAVQNRDIKEINRLLDAGANINEPGGDPSYPPLVWAIRDRHFDVAKLLIERGADVNYWLALQYAAESGDMNTVNLLLEKGAEVNAIGYYGYASPLVAAGRGGKKTVVERLLEKGADLDSALTTCTKKSTDWLHGYYYQPCVSILRSIKAKREAAAQKAAAPRAALQQPAVKPGVSKEEIASIVQAAVERSQKAQDRKTEKEQAVDDIAKPSIDRAARIMGDNDLSVIIGIEGYLSLPKSDYSYDDANLVKEYAKALGFRERNIELLLDERATLSGISKSVEAWLRNKSKPDSRVFVYYSGHGAPDPQTGEAYIVPYDGDPNYLPNTGYALKRLYDSLSRLRAREVVVVLDACFSGSGGRSVLAKGARPLVMTTAAIPAAPNLAVLTATQGAQISTSSSDKGHGIFTYYFLKALKDGKKNVAEIYEYLKPQVEDDAKAINVQQSPSLNPAPEKPTGRFNLRK